MMTLSAYGRLGREPKPITTKTGKAMTVASLAVTVPSREDGERVDATQWVSATRLGQGPVGKRIVVPRPDSLMVIGLENR